MSQAEKILEEIKTLPVDRVAEVLDFIEFIKQKEAERTKYTFLSKEEAQTIVSDVIEKYRPALEELAK